MSVGVEAFSPWLERWGLAPDGEPFETAYTGSRLMPVRQSGRPAMLKIAIAPEERRGAALMCWWAGEGAAAVLAYQGEALLLERAMGPACLARIAANGEDDAATKILVGALAALHKPRAAAPPPDLAPLADWFAGLRAVTGISTPLGEAARIAADLLAHPREIVVLHGDMHHANLLDFGPRGWLAIDPKGLIGERAYDYANILRNNPDIATAVAPGRMRRQVDLISRLTGLEPRRLLQWIVAHAGLSSAWLLEDGCDPSPNYPIIEIALAELSA